MSDDDPSARPARDPAGKSRAGQDLHLLVGQDLPGTRVLGELLRRRRLELARRVDDVAAAAGVTPAYLRMLETGKRAPSPEKAEMLLRALDLTVVADDGADLVVEVDGQRWIIEFKHWATPGMALGGTLGAFLGGPIGMIAGAAAVGGLSHLLGRARQAEEPALSDAELMGRIVQRASAMTGEQLRDLWTALNTIEAAHEETAATEAAAAVEPRSGVDESEPTDEAPPASRDRRHRADRHETSAAPARVRNVRPGS